MKVLPLRNEQLWTVAGARGGVLVVGSVTADVTTFSDRLPGIGETVLGDDLTLVLGGKGANQAVAAARAGVHSYFVGCVGSDVFQALVVEGLRGNGVDIGEVHVVDGATGVAHIRVDASGDNNIVIVPLANSKLSEDHTDQAIAKLKDRVSVMLTQLEIPARIAMHAIRSARSAGMTVILDPAPAVELDEDIWQFVDIVTPNETEASRISGIAVVDADSGIAAARWFCDRGTNSAIVTLGSAGAVLVTRSETAQFEAYPVDALDTTAAGDAFAGYLGAALADGAQIKDAVRRAMAAGALAVTKRGASPSLPMSADVDALLASRISTSNRKDH